MSKWRRWVLPGLASTMILTAAATALTSGGMEADLGRRVSAELAATGQDWVRVSVSGRAITLGGTAPSEEAQRLAATVAEAVKGTGSVSDRSVLLELVSPYTWSAGRSGNQVTLSGFVPSEGARGAILAATRRSLPDAAIVDEMQLARGASPAFGATTTFALERLADLGEGLAAVTDSTLALKGTALSSEAYIRNRNIFRAEVPNVVTLGPVNVIPARAEPFVWSASYDGESVLLAGYVPNEVVKETLVAVARASIPTGTVTDETNIASGESAGFAEAASFAISALGRMRQGGVMLDGLTLDMAGEARSVEDYHAIVDGVGSALPEGVTLVASAVAPAVVEGYGWQGRRDGNRVVLSGYVPSLAGREEVEAAAADIFAGLELDNRTRVAAGEPKMDWIGAIKFAMTQLASLGSGNVEIRDHGYAIEGEARDSDAFAALTDTNSRTLPASLALSRGTIRPPTASPYLFGVSRRGDEVVLSGFAPSESDRRDLVETARTLFSGAGISDELVYGAGAPENFAAAAEVAMDAAARLFGGRARMIDSRVAITGEVFLQHAMETVSADARQNLPDGYSLDLTIMTRQTGQPLDPAGCRDRLQADLKTGRIEFDGGQATLLEASLALLDRVAGTMLRCGEATIEVAAHADSDGSTEQNLKLTQERAEAVVDYLVDAGVRRELLTAMGYGEDNPIADNATEEGKRANRRIEFAVRPAGDG